MMDTQPKRRKDRLNAAICNKNGNNRYYRKRPSISTLHGSTQYGYDLNKFIDVSTEDKLDPELLRIPAHRDFIYPEYHRTSWSRLMARKCPKVTMTIFRDAWEPVEFQTELRESENKNLPAYYYQASQVSNKKVRSKSSGVRRKKKDAITSPKAFACAINNEPVYYPENDVQSKLILVDPPTQSSHEKIIFDPYFKFLVYP